MSDNIFAQEKNHNDRNMFVVIMKMLEFIQKMLFIIQKIMK